MPLCMGSLACSRRPCRPGEVAKARDIGTQLKNSWTACAQSIPAQTVEFDESAKNHPTEKERVIRARPGRGTPFAIPDKIGS